MGVDVLKPVQSVCPGMDPLDLEREFGDRLTFMGGVDTQDLLPNGSPEDVRRETERLVEGFEAVADRAVGSEDDPGRHIEHALRRHARRADQCDVDMRRQGVAHRQKDAVHLSDPEGPTVAP